MSSEIRANAALNENVKAIVQLSGRVYLASLNAMLVARRAGTRGRGFVTVTVELRRFSSELSAAMAQLQEQTAALLQVTTEYERQRRATALIRRATQDLPTADGAAGSFLPRSERALARYAQLGAERRVQVARRVAAAQALCLTGVNIVMCGKVEAEVADGGARLTQVIGEIAVAVEQIQGVLEDLDAALGRGMRRAA